MADELMIRSQGRITNCKTALEAWDYIDHVMRAAKAFKSEMEEELMIFMDDEKIKEIPIDSDRKIIKTLARKGRFETKEIFKSLDFTEEQINILPKNPKFKKTEILRNEKVCSMFWEEESDKLVVKEINKKFTGGE